MNEKTARQIAEMKNQTIGVEVEMNSITRQKAAKVAATYFGTGRYENTAAGTAPGVHGTARDANGNSRRTFPSQGRTSRNANWSPQS